MDPRPPSTAPETTGASQPTPETKEETPAAKPVLVWKDVGLATPASVLYDESSDTYLVSNINGLPLAADNNGFITQLAPEGKVKALKWIEGGKKRVTLNAPKGLAIVGDTLFVADIDTIRMFDKKTGAPTGEVKVPGATFLNDVAPAGDHILVSDSGIKAGPPGLVPSGTDAIYAIDRSKKVRTIAKSKDLGNPNGLLAMGDKTWVVTFGTGELYAIDDKGQKSEVQKLPKGMLDGIVATPAGDLIVSSWEANGFYRGKPGSDFKAAVLDVGSPSDLGYDTKRGRVLVPLFHASEIRVFDLK